jgi:hypothetical protein
MREIIPVQQVFQALGNIHPLNSQNKHKKTGQLIIALFLL